MSIRIFSTFSVLRANTDPISGVAPSKYSYYILKTVFLFLHDLSPHALDTGCCWYPLLMVPRLPSVGFTWVLVPYFPNLAFSGVSPSPMSFNFFPCLLSGFSLFSNYLLYVLKKSGYFILWACMKIALYYQCLIFILLLTVVMTSNFQRLLIFCCDWFQYYLCTYRFFCLMCNLLKYL